MTESELITHTQPPEPITLSVLRARNFRGQKGDAVLVVLKAEFGDKILGESQKIESKGGVTVNDTVFSATLNCAFGDTQALDEIAHRPIVISLTEVLPKEKRQKEEKTCLLGQCTVDLLPLVSGETKFSYTLQINASPGSPLETLPADTPKPEIDVCISVQQSLLVDKNLKNGNLMKITLESLFCPPESWSLSGAQCYYAAALPMPLTEEREGLVVFAHGQLKAGSEKELTNKQKRWPIPGNAQGQSMFIAENFVVNIPIEDEDGDYRSKADKDFRHTAEAEKNRVNWTTERRCFLDSCASKMFQDQIAKNRVWPIEIMRLSPQAAGAKGKKEDETNMGFHGVVFVNLSPLLYPGVNKIRGAYKIWPYSDHLLYEKTKRRCGISDEASKIAMNILLRNSASPPLKKVNKDKDDGKKDVKKGASMTVKSDTSAEFDDLHSINTEGQMYVEAKSFVVLEIVLDRPLIPKRQPDELVRSVAEYIPPRSKFPKRTDGAQRAIADYHCQVTNVANLILDELRTIFGKNIGSENNKSENIEEKSQKLIYELNSSGKYFAFKEQLKHAVVKIVREKFLKTVNFEDKEELQKFLSELYVYLVDQMHIALSDALDIGDQAPVPEPISDLDQLKFFAREAEINENYILAEKYYQERIAREKKNADNWYDYGTFNLYINNLTKAEECLKECISISQKHHNGLMLYGVVCSLLGRREEAETFFEAATNIDPKSILAWTMLGLFYDTIGHDIGAEMAYIEANKLNQLKAIETAKADMKHKLNTDSSAQEKSGLSTPAEATKSPERAVTKSNNPQTDNSSSTAKTTDTTTLVDGKDVGLPSPIGAVQSSNPPSRHRPGTHNTDMSSRDQTPLPTSSIYMQTVNWLLEAKAVQYSERALAHELLLPGAAHGKAAIEYQIALARLNLQCRTFSKAESCLKKALELEQQNPKGWALMGHVKFITGDKDAAKECFERTISFVEDAPEMHFVYSRLASIYLSKKKYREARDMFLMACKRSPSSLSWLGVGVACYRLNELSEAEDALSEANILDNNDPEIWGYLSLICLKLGRKLEAEQTYKYAIKLNLQDDPLLNEIRRLQKQFGFGNPQF